MSKSSYQKSKGRQTTGQFFMLPRIITASAEYASLSAKAVKLLVDIGAQYNGRNNGDLCCAWKIMIERGWKSKDTLYKAQSELERSGFIVRTRQGGRNLPNLFAVTWLAIDDCRTKEGAQKLDVKPTQVPSNSWKSTMKKNS